MAEKPEDHRQDDAEDILETPTSQKLLVRIARDSGRTRVKTDELCGRVELVERAIFGAPADPKGGMAWKLEKLLEAEGGRQELREARKRTYWLAVGAMVTAVVALAKDRIAQWLGWQ